MTFNFVRYLIANPEKIEELPDFAILEFVEPEFVEEPKDNKVCSNETMLYVKVKNSFEIVH